MAVAQGQNIPPLRLWPAAAASDLMLGCQPGVSSGGAIYADDLMWAIPVGIGESYTCTGMKLHVDTGQAGSKALMGLYGSTADQTGPGSLIARAAQFTPTITEHVEASFVGGNQTIAPGLYWLIYTTDTAAIALESTGTAGAMRWGGVEAAANNDSFTHLNYARVYVVDNLPATYSASPTRFTGKPPRLWLIIAA